MVGADWRLHRDKANVILQVRLYNYDVILPHPLATKQCEPSRPESITL